MIRHFGGGNNWQLLISHNKIHYAPSEQNWYQCQNEIFSLLAPPLKFYSCLWQRCCWTSKHVLVSFQLSASSNSRPSSLSIRFMFSMMTYRWIKYFLMEFVLLFLIRWLMNRILRFLCKLGILRIKFQFSFNELLRIIVYVL